MATTEAPSSRRLLRIGDVCNRLQDEFPDVSISKVRYLEDQGLLTPRRTQGGYRLFSEDDVEEEMNRLGERESRLNAESARLLATIQHLPTPEAVEERSKHWSTMFARRMAGAPDSYSV